MGVLGHVSLDSESVWVQGKEGNERESECACGQTGADQSIFSIPIHLFATASEAVW